MHVPQKGIVSLIILGLVLMGIGAGIYLINRPAIFGSKASSFPYAAVELTPVCDGVAPKVKVKVKYAQNSSSAPYVIHKQTTSEGDFEVFGDASANAGSEQLNLEGGQSLNLDIYETIDSQIQIGTWYTYKATTASRTESYESIPVMVIGPDCGRGGPILPAVQIPVLPQLPSISPVIPIPSEVPIAVPSGMPSISPVPSVSPVFPIPSEIPVPIPSGPIVLPSLPPIPSMPPSLTDRVRSSLKRVTCLVGQVSRVVDSRLVCATLR